MRPRAEVRVSPALVEALIREQHEDFAHLPVHEAGEGWDNALYRLGDHHAVRLPRHAAAASLVEREQQWLPHLAARLPVPIPAPQRVGRPGRGFPWAWSITPWFEGAPLLTAPVGDLSALALALGTFLRALHEAAPPEAPRNPWRGGPLATREAALREHLPRVGSAVDRQAVRRVWARAVATPEWSRPPLWIHGDLHPGNLLVHRDRLAAVIDFGDLAAGDPATDLSIAWMVLPPRVRSEFFAAARAAGDALDANTVMRARGWALALALAYMANGDDDPALRALGSRTLDAVLADDTVRVGDDG